MSDFIETSGEVARQARVTPALVSQYARAGLIEFRALSNGTRLFPPGTATKVRQILERRMADRVRRVATGT